MNVDFQLLKIQHEILGISLEELAHEVGLSVGVLKARAEKDGWQEWWPEAKVTAKPVVDIAADPETGIVPDPSDVLKMETQKFIKLATYRLEVYNYARQLYLARRYFELESNLIDKAATYLRKSKTDASGMRSISALYKDLKTSPHLSGMKSGSQGASDLFENGDGDGTTTVIVQDLTGRHGVFDDDSEES